MSGSAAYYINESMSESSGDSLNNSNNGNNNLAKTLHQMRNGINEAGRLNGIGMKGNYQVFIKFTSQETMYKPLKLFDIPCHQMICHLQEIK